MNNHWSPKTEFGWHRLYAKCMLIQCHDFRKVRGRAQLGRPKPSYHSQAFPYSFANLRVLIPWGESLFMAGLLELIEQYQCRQFWSIRMCFTWWEIISRYSTHVLTHWVEYLNASFIQVKRIFICQLSLDQLKRLSSLLSDIKTLGSLKRTNTVSGIRFDLYDKTSSV